MHDTGLACWKAEGTKRHIAVQEPPLVDEAQDLSFAHTLIHPFLGPVIKDKLSYVPRRLAGAEQELLRLATHKDEA